MKKSRFAATRLGFVGFLSMLFLSSCAIPTRLPFSRPASVTRNNAFIAYWPPPRGSLIEKVQGALGESKLVRLAVKDLIDMKGVVTTAGSEYLAKNSSPAQNDAACLAIARERGVEIVGKTNLSEFAVAPSGFNEYYGTPKNRMSRRVKLIPGGSSSGSAVAVQNGMADITFGTDTAGSIRVPAACCGIVGLKTTFGLVPLSGVFPVEPSHLDTVGPMARNIADTVQGMALLEKGFEERYKAAVEAKPSGRQIRIGRLYLSGTDPKVNQAVDDALSKAHFKVVPLDPGFTTKWEQAKKDGDTVAAAGAWLSDRKYFGRLGVTGKTEAIIALGEFEYATNYQNALKRQAAWQQALRQVFKKVDFIALPTLQTRPPGSPSLASTALLEAKMLGLQNTVAVNFAGNPALAIPIPFDDWTIRLTSLQLIGPRLSEAALLNAGRLVEASVNTSIDRSRVAKSAKP